MKRYFGAYSRPIDEYQLHWTLLTVKQHLRVYSPAVVTHLFVFSQMTDVEAGGSTVFLDAETIIKPQKVLLSS